MPRPLGRGNFGYRGLKAMASRDEQLYEFKIHDAAP